MSDPTRGPCGPWPAQFCSTIPAASAAVSGSLLLAATQILYYKTAQIFDQCEFTLRPCRDDCYSNMAGWLWRDYGWSLWGGGPTPYLYRGAWYNLTCSSGCGNSCSCVALEETTLPGPVTAVTEVKLDGVVMPTTSYRIDDFRKLVRIDGGVWPFCQDMTAPDTADGTWSVTATIGEVVPDLGQWAVGELALDLMLGCSGGDCVLPRNVTSVTRQGVTVEYERIAELLDHGFLGLKFCDLFVNTYNPKQLRTAPRVYNVDGPEFRRVGTA